MTATTTARETFRPWSKSSGDTVIVLTYPEGDGRAPRTVGAGTMDGQTVERVNDAHDEGENVEPGQLFRVRDGKGRTWCAWVDELEEVAR